jgi:hypothetical protein
MPEISRFYGIIIYMFFNENTAPHFKIKYAGLKGDVLIENDSLLNGGFLVGTIKKFASKKYFL